MFLSQFYQRQGQIFQITPEQASSFAKSVAEDFNPIHDTDAKRFCVPGDLMFSLVLGEYGISQTMSFSFEGMLGAGRSISFPSSPEQSFSITDADSDKTYLSVERQGEVSPCPGLAEAFIKAYVAFSGHNFPHILVPLMKKHQVMINPARPLVMYEGMSFNLERLDFDNPELLLGETELEVDGKRGNATLHFDIACNGKIVGHGSKKLVLSGLRPYCAEQIKVLEETYEQRKQTLAG